MEGDERRPWTLLTSHGHVLVEIARNPRARVRDISGIIGITERATQAIIADLERAGYVERVREGRRTRYVLHTDNPFRHSSQDGLRVGPFLELLTGATEPDTTAATAAPAAAAVSASADVPASADVSPLEPVAASVEPAGLPSESPVPPLDPAPQPAPGPAPLVDPAVGQATPGLDLPDPGAGPPTL